MEFVSGKKKFNACVLFENLPGFDDADRLRFCALCNGVSLSSDEAFDDDDDGGGAVDANDCGGRVFGGAGVWLRRVSFEIALIAPLAVVASSTTTEA